MSTKKIKFICSVCGEESPKWSGKCEQCGGWNTFKEQEVATEKTAKVSFDRGQFDLEKSLPKLLKDIPTLKVSRIPTGSQELDRVLSGGIVPGSLGLISGDPGVGKSTLALQVAAKVSQDHPVLYISGEESLNQIKLRSERLKINSEKLHLFAETSLDNILKQIKEIKPHLIIVDSVQTLHSNSFTGTAGSISQVSNCTNILLDIAKATNIPIVLIGHVTKEGSVAGPMVLEHIVDTLLFLEGERYHDLRILRVIKNRFGSTLEVGVFKMEEKGLLEVLNPSGLFLEERLAGSPGSVIFAMVDGNRPFLTEVQALANKTVLAYPRRTASGINLNRLQVLIAVLQKCCNLKLHNTDVYLNVVGGFKVKEPASDLAVCLAIASSLLGKPFPTDTVAIGEVGLLGDLRSVNQLEKRVEEAKRLGFKKCLVGGKKVPDVSGIEIKQVKSLLEGIKMIADSR
ncbi:DNA repair protein RadA [Patescibacteria group bacterium]